MAMNAFTAHLYLLFVALLDFAFKLILLGAIWCISIELMKLRAWRYWHKQSAKTRDGDSKPEVKGGTGHEKSSR
jgi:hypothetical protein